MILEQKAIAELLNGICPNSEKHFAFLFFKFARVCCWADDQVSTNVQLPAHVQCTKPNAAAFL